MINQKKFVFIFLILFFSMSIANANIYLGVVEGYIKDINNNVIAGADVTVTLDSCSGGGCSGTAVSQTNGYYVIGNLDTSPGSTVNVDAIKDDLIGFEIDITDEDGLGFVNVTIAKRPDKPTMISTILNRRTVNLYCEPGEDTNIPELPVHVIVQSSPLSNGNFNIYDETGNVSFGSHTWQCRTCNDYVCSDWEFDTFELTNNPPSEPVLIPQEHTEKTDITFNWDSGVDPDGDETYDQFYFNGEITTEESPVTKTELDTYACYIWGVRTCDIYDYCSDWVYDEFTICETDTKVVSRNGARVSYVEIELPSYNLTIFYPNFVLTNDTFKVSVEIESNQDLRELEYEIREYEKGITQLDYFEDVGENKANLEYLFKIDSEEEIEIDFIFLGKKDNYSVIRREFTISAIELDVPETEISRLRIIPIFKPVEPEVIPIPAWIVAIIVTALLLIYYYERRLKRFGFFRR